MRDRAFNDMTDDSISDAIAQATQAPVDPKPARVQKIAETLAQEQGKTVMEVWREALSQHRVQYEGHQKKTRGGKSSTASQKSAKSGGSKP